MILQTLYENVNGDRTGKNKMFICALGRTVVLVLTLTALHMKIGRKY